MRPSSRWPLAAAAFVLAACGHHHRTVVIREEPPRHVEIEVEVFDPETNGVWEGVSVRVVEGYHEWSGLTLGAGNPDLWLVTDATGRVLFTATDLADADVGFREDQDGHAILVADRREDEAFVLLEIDAVGFDRVFVDVPLSWDTPAVLVSVPFGEPSPGNELLGEQPGEALLERRAASLITVRARDAGAVQQHGSGQ